MEHWQRWWSALGDSLNRTLKCSVIFLLRLYRATFSLWTGPVCRFQPTCSHYAEEAFRTHSPLFAFWLTLKRLIKCHPLGPFGYDPVPLKPSRSKST